MRRVYSNSEVRAAEQRAMEAGTSALALMERAGKALAEEVLGICERLKISEALFVCGGGNNGGDGFCAAELLRGKIDVQVLCLAEKFSKACLTMRSRYGGEILSRIPRRRYALIVECLMGTGARGTPKGNVKELIEFIGRSGAYVLSCDLPAGLNEGGAGAIFVKANRTLSIGAEKQALMLADGADATGEIAVANIGLYPEGGAEVWEEADVRVFFPARASHVHKGNFGCAAILSDVSAYPNAPLFAARACTRSGVGYTKLFAAEPLFSAAIGRSAALVQRFEGLEPVLSADAIAIGMGAGTNEALYGEILNLSERYEGTLILDADALNVCAAHGFEFLKQKKCRAVLTPHIGEFARLTGKGAEEILADAVPLSLAFAKEYGVTLILKNNRSVITDGERVAINPTGCAALAKGGSGDILTGLLAGTCARGVGAYEAACVASFLLGRAGELASRGKGDYGATADDVIEYLPEAILALRAEDAHADR